jgi:hypothetical protein
MHRHLDKRERGHPDVLEEVWVFRPWLLLIDGLLLQLVVPEHRGFHSFTFSST